MVLWEPLNFLIIGLRVAPTQFEYGTQTNSGKMYWVPTRIFWGKRQSVCEDRRTIFTRVKHVKDIPKGEDVKTSMRREENWDRS